MEEASWKAEEDQRIAGEKAMATLLENSEGMLAKEFASRIRGIEWEFGLVSIGEGGDNTMEVSEGENTGDVNRSQNLGNQNHPMMGPSWFWVQKCQIWQQSQDCMGHSGLKESHLGPRLSMAMVGNAQVY